MNAIELERIARDVVPPVGRTGWRATTLERGPDGRTIFAVVPIIDGRLDGKPVFRGAQRDIHRLMDLLEGRPTSRRSRDIPAVTDASGEPDRAITEAPVADASLSLPHMRPGAEPLGVTPIRSADAPGATAAIEPSERARAGQSDGDPAGSGRAIASASPGRNVRLCAGCGQPLPAGARPNRRTHNGACRIRAARKRGGAKPASADADSDVTVSSEERGFSAPRSALAPAAPITGGDREQIESSGGTAAGSPSSGAGEGLPPGSQPAPATPTSSVQPSTAAVPAGAHEGGAQQLSLAYPSG